MRSTSAKDHWSLGLRAIVVVLALLAAHSPAHAGTPCSATSLFADPALYGVGSNPFSVAAADFNSDGFADIAAVNYGSGTVSILLNSGNGTFGSAVDYGVAPSAVEIVIGDFNRDGINDLAVTANGGVDVLLGRGSAGHGDGTFAPAAFFAAGLPVFGI